MRKNHLKLHAEKNPRNFVQGLSLIAANSSVMLPASGILVKKFASSADDEGLCASIQGKHLVPTAVLDSSGQPTSHSLLDRSRHLGDFPRAPARLHDGIAFMSYPVDETARANSCYAKSGPDLYITSRERTIDKRKQHSPRQLILALCTAAPSSAARLDT